MGYGRCNGCGRPDLLMDGLCYWCERSAVIFSGYERDDNGGEQTNESEAGAALQTEAGVAGVRELPILRE